MEPSTVPLLQETSTYLASMCADSNMGHQAEDFSLGEFFSLFEAHQQHEASSVIPPLQQVPFNCHELMLKNAGFNPNSSPCSSNITSQADTVNQMLSSPPYPVIKKCSYIPFYRAPCSITSGELVEGMDPMLALENCFSVVTHDPSCVITSEAMDTCNIVPSMCVPEVMLAAHEQKQEEHGLDPVGNTLFGSHESSLHVCHSAPCRKIKATSPCIGVASTHEEKLTTAKNSIGFFKQGFAYIEEPLKSSSYVAAAQAFACISDKPSNNSYTTAIPQPHSISHEALGKSPNVRFEQGFALIIDDPNRPDAHAVITSQAHCGTQQRLKPNYADGISPKPRANPSSSSSSSKVCIYAGQGTNANPDSTSKANPTNPSPNPNPRQDPNLNPRSKPNPRRNPKSSSSPNINTTSNPNLRRHKVSVHPQGIAARRRRHRISNKFKVLQTLVPGGTKMDTASMLDEAIEYIKYLRHQIWLHELLEVSQMINPHSLNTSDYGNHLESPYDYGNLSPPEHTIDCSPLLASRNTSCAACSPAPCSSLIWPNFN